MVQSAYMSACRVANLDTQQFHDCPNVTIRGFHQFQCTNCCVRYWVIYTCIGGSLYACFVVHVSYTPLQCLAARSSVFSNWLSRLREAVGRRPLQYAPPMYATRCGPAPAHTRLTPGLQRPARLGSSSCGFHEYSRCTRQTSSDVRRQTASLLNAPA